MKSQKTQSIHIATPKILLGVELRNGFQVKPPVPRHWHQEYQFCLIQGGSGTVTYKGAKTDTPPGSLFMIPPAEVHSNECTDATGCSYRTIFLEPGVVDGFFEDAFDRRVGSLTLPVVTDQQDIIRTFNRLFVALQDNESRLAAESALSEFFIAANRHVGRELPEKPLDGDHLGLAKAFDYLRSRLDENISLDSLAKEANMSRFHFSRAFTAVYGLPPHLCQTQMRVNRAKRLLLDGQSIGESAINVGFADQSHLTRNFKRLTAVTPGQYARLSKNVQDLV